MSEEPDYMKPVKHEGDIVTFTNLGYLHTTATSDYEEIHDYEQPPPKYEEIGTCE